MAEYQTIIVAVVSALSSGVGVGISLKTDVKWLRLMMKKRDERLTRLEARPPELLLNSLFQIFS
ncbi:hypothetical protein [Vibrio splendidus]|uniref:hypothetical protein n=1 Tax=Vibrio splendidus TaxID=29497 RepID=UPI000C851640|nr:hypothetical protein [Vibrio splendidus]